MAEWISTATLVLQEWQTMNPKCLLNDSQCCPQNQTFAHAHIISNFCHGFNSSLIQIHTNSLHFSIIFPIDSIMSQSSHDISLYSLKIHGNSCFPRFQNHYRRIYIYISATRSNNTYKGLIMVVYFILSRIHTPRKMPLSAGKPGIRESQKKLGSFYPKKT